jgi:hypothetical protein
MSPSYRGEVLYSDFVNDMIDQVSTMFPAVTGLEPAAVQALSKADCHFYGWGLPEEIVAYV